MSALKEALQVGGHAGFFAAFQLEQHVLLAGKVEEEGSVRDACGCRDRVHVGTGHASDCELGDRRAEDAFPRLQSAQFASRLLDLRRHGPLFVSNVLTKVNECSH